MNQPNTPTHQNPHAVSSASPEPACPELAEGSKGSAPVTPPAHDPNPFHRPGYTRFIYANGYIEYMPHHPAHDLYPIEAFDGTLPQNQPDHPSQRLPNNVDDLLPPNHTQKPNVKNNPPQPTNPHLTNNPQNHHSLSTPAVPPVTPCPACPEPVEVARQAQPNVISSAPNIENPSTPNAPLQSVGLRPTSPTATYPSPTTPIPAQPSTLNIKPATSAEGAPNPSVPLSASAVNPDTLPKVNFAQYNHKPTPPPPGIRTITLPSIKTLLLMPRGESYHRYPQAYPAQQTTLPRYYHEIETGTNTPRPEAPPEPAYLERIRKLIAKTQKTTTGTNDKPETPTFLYNGHTPSVIFQRNARRLSREDWEHILEMLYHRAATIENQNPPTQFTYAPYIEFFPNPFRPKNTNVQNNVHQLTNDYTNHNSLCTIAVPAVPPRQEYSSIPQSAPNIKNPSTLDAPLQSVGLCPTSPTTVHPSPSTPAPCPHALRHLVEKCRTVLFPPRLKERKNSSGLCYSHIATANIAKYLTNDHPHTWQSPEFHELLLTFAENTRPPPAPRNTNLTTTTKKRSEPKTPFSELDLHETLAQWYDRCGAPMFKNDMNDHAFAYHLHIKNLANDDPLSPLASIPYDTDAHTITFTLNEKYKVLHIQLHPDPESPQKEELQTPNEPPDPKNPNPTQKTNDTITTTPPQPKKPQTIPIPSNPQKPQTSQQILTSHPQTPPTHEPQNLIFHPTN